MLLQEAFKCDLGRILINKISLWVDTHSGSENILHGSSRSIEKRGTLLQTEKAVDNSHSDLTCHVFSLENAVVHLSISNPNGDSTIEIKAK